MKRFVITALFTSALAVAATSCGEKSSKDQNKDAPAAPPEPNTGNTSSKSEKPTTDSKGKVSPPLPTTDIKPTAPVVVTDTVAPSSASSSTGDIHSVATPPTRVLASAILKHAGDDQVFQLANGADGHVLVHGSSAKAFEGVSDSAVGSDFLADVEISDSTGSKLVPKITNVRRVASLSGAIQDSRVNISNSKATGGFVLSQSSLTGIRLFEVNRQLRETKLPSCLRRFCILPSSPLIDYDFVRSTLGDVHGNTYVAGEKMGGFFVGSALFVTKLSASGLFVWRKEFTSDSSFEIGSLATESDGNVSLGVASIGELKGLPGRGVNIVVFDPQDGNTVVRSVDSQWRGFLLPPRLRSAYSKTWVGTSMTGPWVFEATRVPGLSVAQALKGTPVTWDVASDGSLWAVVANRDAYSLVNIDSKGLERSREALPQFTNIQRGETVWLKGDRLVFAFSVGESASAPRGMADLAFVVVDTKNRSE